MSEKKDKFYLSLIGLASNHRKYSMLKFNRLGLTTGQPKVLAVLMEKEGYTQKDLAKRCRVEPATLTTILKSMEMKDLICKRPITLFGGKKAYSIYMTEHGRIIAEQMQEVIRETESTSFLGFTEEERDTMIAWMKRIQDNIINELNRQEEINNEV